MHKILIADDHDVTRRGIVEIVNDDFPGAAITELRTFTAVTETVDGAGWDLILLDIMMPGGQILDVISHIRRADPKVPILVLTAATELEYVLQTMKAGANGVIHKHLASDDLVLAIRQVAGGGSYLHPDTAVAIARTLNEPSPLLPHHSLSARERDIFCRLARGRVIKEIAGDLGISDKTVATYLARIRGKTGLTGHVEITRYALLNKLVD